MAGIAQTEQQGLPIEKADSRKLDPTRGIAAIALVLALLSLFVGASKASSGEIQDVRDTTSLDIEEASQNLHDVQTQLVALKTKLGDAEDELAKLDSLTADMAAASKVEAALQALQSNIDSLRRTVSSLCAEVNTSPITAPYPGSC